MVDASERAAHSARELARRLGKDHHDVLVVLGSGLTGAAEILGGGTDPHPLDTLPFFPPYGVDGHRPQCWSTSVSGLEVLVLGGRCHLYEGLGPTEVVHPVRMGIAAGCTTVILTAAAGAVRDDLVPGSLVVVEDHINLTGRSPLSGPAFVDMTDAYSPRLAQLARSLPSPAGDVLAARGGVYAQLPGPQLETPAEIRMIRALGADLVGMSMALETVAARAAGADVLGLALVTNEAATAGASIDLAAITEVGRAASPALASVVSSVLGSVP